MTDETTTVPTISQVTVFQTSDGVKHDTEEAAKNHEAGLRFNKIVYAYVGAKALKGRTKSYAAEMLRDFLVWNAARVAAEQAPQPAE